MVSQHVQTVAVGLPLVDDHRQIQLLGQLQLLLKGQKLLPAGHILIVVVQADFSDGADLGACGQLAVHLQGLLSEAVRRVWVRAHGAVDKGILL